MGVMDSGTWNGLIYSGGWAKSSGGDAAVTEPATGQEIARTGIGNAEDIAGACARAAAAQRGWAAVPFEERAAILRRAGSLFEENAADIEGWLVRESGS